MSQMSEGDYQAGLADPPPPEEPAKPGTIGELVETIRRFSLLDLRVALTCAWTQATDGRYAEAYKAAGAALEPFVREEMSHLEALVDAQGPDELADAPETLHKKNWQRRRWSGKHFATPVFGWRVSLNRAATPEEKAWFHRHGYTYVGGRWGRPEVDHG